MSVVSLILLYLYTKQGFVYYIVQYIMSRLSTAGEFNKDAIRFSQIRAMLGKWLESPIIGLGKGYPVYYYRDSVFTASYGAESSYFVLLYQEGLRDLLFFIAVVYSSIKILKKRKDAKWLADPFITGMLCFLLANAFNRKEGLIPRSLLR